MGLDDPSRLRLVKSDPPVPAPSPELAARLDGIASSLRTLLARTDDCAPREHDHLEYSTAIAALARTLESDRGARLDVGIVVNQLTLELEALRAEVRVLRAELAALRSAPGG